MFRSLRVAAVLFLGLTSVGSSAADEAPKPKPAQADERLFGYWEPDGFWYPGQVARVEGEKSFFQFADGDEAWLKKDQMQTFNVKVGTRVQGNWQNDGAFYNGRVTKRSGDAIHIVYDDGDVEDTTIASVRLRLQVAEWLTVGRTVFARWDDDGHWYPGKIGEKKDGKFFIQFDDGDTSWVNADGVLIWPVAPGDRVEGDFQNAGTFYPGTIAAVEGNRVRINYDDGDVEETTVSRLRMQGLIAK